jgi:hypothetical protein
VLWRASHGSVGEKTGSFGAPALKAGFVTDRQAKPACPLARLAQHRKAANEQKRRAASNKRLHFMDEIAGRRSSFKRSVRTSDRHHDRLRRPNMGSVSETSSALAKGDVK